MSDRLGRRHTAPGVSFGVGESQNARIDRENLALWATSPDKHQAYFTFKELPSQLYRPTFRFRAYELEKATITTWLGVPLGVITSAYVYTNNFRTRIVSLTVKGTNGATYYGRASYDNGSCINLRKEKR